VDVAAASNLASNDPDNFWQIRSSWDLSETSQFDLTLRHASRLANLNVPSYTALDLRYAWQISRELELAVIGQDLSNPRHAEFVPSEFSRAVMVNLTRRQ